LDDVVRQGVVHNLTQQSDVPGNWPASVRKEELDQIIVDAAEERLFRAESQKGDGLHHRMGTLPRVRLSFKEGPCAQARPPPKWPPEDEDTAFTKGKLQG